MVMKKVKDLWSEVPRKPVHCSDPSCENCSTLSPEELKETQELAQIAFDAFVDFGKKLKGRRNGDKAFASSVLAGVLRAAALKNSRSGGVVFDQSVVETSEMIEFIPNSEGDGS